MEIYPPDRKPGDLERATLNSIIAELRNEANNPTNNDPIIAAFSEAASYLLTTPNDDRLRLSVGFMLDFRQDPDSDSFEGKKEEPFTSQYASKLLLRAFQHIILLSSKLPKQAQFAQAVNQFHDYPHGRESPSKWLTDMDVILSNGFLHDMFDQDLVYRRVQSNIAERYKGPKLAVLKDYAGRFSGPLNILDVGASLNLGLTKLVIESPFMPIEVLTQPAGELDKAMTKWANSLNHSGLFSIDTGIGIDIFQMFDPNTREWVRSCSFYPSELLDRQKTSEFDSLVTANEVLDAVNASRLGHAVVNTNLGKLKHYTGDFSDEASLAGFEQLVPEEKFHLATFVTIMHQLSPAEIKAMLNHARQFLRDDGLIIIQDFVNVNEQAPNKLEFPHWDKFTYKTLVIDPSEGDLTPRESIIWDYGRCNQAIML